MSLAITITSIDSMTGGGYLVNFNVKASGNYVTGGDTLDFTQATLDPAFQGTFALPPPTTLGPSQLDCWSQGGNFTQGYVASAGAALNNSKMVVLTALGSQLSAGAYPAGVTGDSICGSAVFRKF